MRNLLNFLSRYSNLIVFILLETISVWLLVNAEGYHSSRFLNGIRNSTLFIERKAAGVTYYLGLKEKNARLASENLFLRNRVESMSREIVPAGYADTTVRYAQDYLYILARVANNSVNKQYNFITLDRGSRDGIEPEMAVIGSDGVAGIVVSVSENFSYVMSLLNLDFRMSVRLRKNAYFGSLTWDGHSATRAILNEIPYHVNVAVGDTIETSGYSSIFPPGVLVGTVSDIDESGGDFYRIVLELSTDFRKLNYLYVVRNRLKDEQTEAEGEARNE
ncbi:MAG: rod shape-determining protein MreC [Bacteroidales bacterium]|nr:rod shape-determining protein MreC [Bacteroidales bacterium]